MSKRMTTLGLAFVGLTGMTAVCGTALGHDIEGPVDNPGGARAIDATAVVALSPLPDGPRTRTVGRSGITQGTTRLGELDPHNVMRSDPQPIGASSPAPGTSTGGSNAHGVGIRPLLPGSPQPELEDSNRANACSPADVVAPYGTLDLFDVLTFVEAMAEGDPSADFDENGIANVFDLLEYFRIYSEGCDASAS